MPRGKVKDWKGKIGTVVSEHGVQHLFTATDLVGLDADALADGLIVEFDSVKAGSGWQAKKVRPTEDQSWGGKAHQAATAKKTAAPRDLDTAELLALVPLPRVVREILGQVPVRDRHPGLHLDKFLKPGRRAEALAPACDIPPGPLFAEALDRRRDLLAVVEATTWTRTTATPLALHPGREAGSAGVRLHPLHGFAYLPGSAVKGLARAHAERMYPDQAETIHRVFGGDEVGGVVFHDAWPEAWPTLTVEVATDHHGPYYAGDADPGDWHEPTATHFLAVAPGATFAFALSPRRPEDAELVTIARQWLDEALTVAGIGARRNAGYGGFTPIEGGPLPLSSRFATFQATLTLTTPGYLAGGLQRGEDCDLRPATVRGLLRWWWRTLHVGFLDTPTLRAMEEAVWGAVRVNVERLPGGPPPIESPFKDVNPQTNRTRFSREFREGHDLWDAPEGRTQGLAYAALGMDEGSPPERVRRWVAPAGTAWRLTLTAESRDGLAAEAILKQAKTALWWWAYLGGAGSRSRKGFGSFADPAELKDFEGGRWLSLGKEFRKDHGLPETDFNPAWATSPSIYLMRELAKSLNQNPWLEVPTIWTDPWRALDEVGMAMQTFAQAAPKTGHGKHCDRKRHLGLPRQLHGPKDRPTHHQNAATHRRPEALVGVHGERHAAPVFYHVAGTPGGRLTIRVAAFPVASLRRSGMSVADGLRECTQVHRELLTALAAYLGTRKDAR